MTFPTTPYSILCPITVPSTGARLVFHALRGISSTQGGELLMQVDSYLDATAKSISWQDRYPIPVAAIADPADPMLAAANALVATGAPFAGGTVLTPSQTELEVSAAITSMLIKSARDEAVAAGQYVDNVGVVDSDAESQRLITGAVVAAQVQGAEFSVQWRLANNSLVMLNQAQMIAVGLAVVERVSACQQRKNELDALVSQATTIAALAAIPINEGWPAIGEPQPA